MNQLVAIELHWAVCAQIFDHFAKRLYLLLVELFGVLVLA